MGTKENPGEYDCYSKAKPDEPMFVLLARDPLSPSLVRLWARMRHLLAIANPAKMSNYNEDLKQGAAYRCADQMEAWRSKNRSRVVNPYPTVIKRWIKPHIMDTSEEGEKDESQP